MSSVIPLVFYSLLDMLYRHRAKYANFYALSIIISADRVLSTDVVLRCNRNGKLCLVSNAQIIC